MLQHCGISFGIELQQIEYFVLVNLEEPARQLSQHKTAVTTEDNRTSQQLRRAPERPHFLVPGMSLS